MNKRIKSINNKDVIEESDESD